jgi:dCMP deaminase
MNVIKNNWKKAFMDAAIRFAQESYAERLKVGAIIVKDNRIISIGINGMPSGWNNCCEYDHYDVDICDTFKKSKPEVLHAETNAIAKLAKSSESGKDAAMFVTHAPCLDCAKLIYQAGITEVYYNQEYRSDAGIEFLDECNIIVKKLNT